MINSFKHSHTKPIVRTIVVFLYGLHNIHYRYKYKIIMVNFYRLNDVSKIGFILFNRGV